MKVKVLLLDTNLRAQDNSTIPLSKVKEYLQSEDYAELVKNKNRLGGITHKDRTPKESDIGPDDQLLLNNPVHYIEKIYIEDTKVYGIAVILDENQADENQKKDIIKIKGLLRQKVMVPISLVVRALWDATDVAQKIVSIRGFDWTLNPSFEGSGSEEIIEDQKNFSITPYVTTSPKGVLEKVGGHLCRSQLKVFSSNTEIELEHSKIYSDSSFDENMVEVDSGQLDEDNIIETEEELEEAILNPNSEIDQREFSSPSSITERLRMTKLPIRPRLQRLIIAYRRYMAGPGKKLDEKDLKEVKNMFLAEFNIIFSSVIPDIRKNKQLNTLLGMNAYGRDVIDASKRLTPLYRRALISEETMGAIPKNIYSQLTKAYNSFMNSIINFVFKDSKGLRKDSQTPLNK